MIGLSSTAKALGLKMTERKNPDSATLSIPNIVVVVG